MVREALKFLTSEVRGLHRAAYVLASAALLSSVLALMRDRLLAHMFGASTTLDIYYAAFRIPDLIFVLLGALVSVYMLIPELSRREQESRSRYIDTIVVGFCLLAVALSGIAAVLAPALLSKLFPQYVANDQLPTLVMLTRIMLLQPILLGFSNILAAITQIKHRYALYAMSPLLYNLGIILGVVALYPVFGIAGLAMGVVAGALMHAAIQIPAILKDGFFHALPRLHEPQALFATMLLSMPRALALSMNQLTIFGLTAIAGMLASGSIAVYMFAYNLQAVPLAIIGASYSVAAFPTLASALAAGARDEFIKHVASAARYVLFWSLPATGLIIVLRAHIVRVILGSGNFDWTDTRLTAAAFALLSTSLAAQGITLLLVRGYYAAGRTFVPFLASLAVAMGTVTASWILVYGISDELVLSFAESLLRVQDVPGTAVLWLAFAYSTISILGTCALLWHFDRRFGGFLHRIERSFYESLFAAIAASTSAYLVLIVVGEITLASTTVSVLTRGFIAGSIGIIVATLAYIAVRSQELAEIMDAIRGRFQPVPEGVTPVATSAEDINPTTTQ